MSIDWLLTKSALKLTCSIARGLAKCSDCISGRRFALAVMFSVGVLPWSLLLLFRKAYRNRVCVHLQINMCFRTMLLSWIDRAEAGRFSLASKIIHQLICRHGKRVRIGIFERHSVWWLWVVCLFSMVRHTVLRRRGDLKAGQERGKRQGKSFSPDMRLHTNRK